MANYATWGPQWQSDRATLDRLYENAVSRAFFELKEKNPDFTDADLYDAIQEEQQIMGLVLPTNLAEYRKTLEIIERLWQDGEVGAQMTNYSTRVVQRQQDILTLGHLHENAVTRAAIKLVKENPNFTDIDLDVAVQKEQQEMGLLPAIDLDEYRKTLERIERLLQDDEAGRF